MYFYIVICLVYSKIVFGQITLNNCEAKQTCDKCIQEIDCAWCINPQKDNTGKSVHCRSKSYDSSWCREGYQSPVQLVSIVADENFSNHTDHPIQIKPQRVQLKLRKGEKYNLHFRYKMTENYPVDLYYLMDLSNSMRPYKNKLAELGDELAQAMRKLTTNFKLGFGGFIDKVELPFVSTDENKLISPCNGCASPYAFNNYLSLTNNYEEFVQNVNDAKISGNIDAPEGGFDALMQVIVCKEKIKWREQARHLLVFSTDEEYHLAGDGKLAGVIEPNVAKCFNDSKDYYRYDYPSISQINYVAKQNKINIIFAIVKTRNSDMDIRYSKLSKMIENSNFGLLQDKDTHNVINLVVENYKKIAQLVKMTSNASKEVDVKFTSTCPSTIPGRCSNVHVGQTLDFTATIEPRECSSNNKQFIKIYPEALDQSLIVELDIVCECSCSSNQSDTFEEKSKKCSEQGDLKCGVCDCSEGRFGTTCQCDKRYTESENSTQCIMDGTSDICSRLGECKCGKCECFTRSNPDEEIYGKFCECNNYSCKKEKGLMCSGKGRCNCKVCECNAGYSGEACECEENTAKCIAPGSDKICAGHGECVCGQCECIRDDKKYSGKYCEDCITCPAQRCEELRHCAVCKIHKTGDYNEEQCEKLCNYTIIGVSKLEGNDNEMIKKCRVLDKEKCIVTFEYEYEKEAIVVRVLKERSCPEPVNVIGWIIGVITAVLLGGIIALIIWKVCTTIHDHREYAKFENERNNMKWQTNKNPLYKDAYTTFQNPIFNKTDKQIQEHISNGGHS